MVKACERTYGTIQGLNKKYLFWCVQEAEMIMADLAEGRELSLTRSEGTKVAWLRLANGLAGMAASSSLPCCVCCAFQVCTRGARDGLRGIVQGGWTLRGIVQVEDAWSSDHAAPAKLPFLVRKCRGWQKCGEQVWVEQVWVEQVLVEQVLVEQVWVSSKVYW